MPSRFHTLPNAVNAKTRRAFRSGLVRWYYAHKRDLPWRRTHDPYRIWVSEIMLQQTRVETVKPYYQRWLRAFPTVAVLARASSTRVLKLWEGLGYYSRARNLQRAAKMLVNGKRNAAWRGEFPPTQSKEAARELRRPVPRSRQMIPTTAAGWRELPGIGPYTAAAIASIALGERVPVVDGNVARVLARVFGWRGNVKRPAAGRDLVALAAQLIPARRPGDFNQALMELGALVCTPLEARCPVCPLRGVCVARRRGWVDALPHRGKRTRWQAVEHRVVVVRRRGRVLVVQRPANGLLAGMWQLPEARGNGFTTGRQLFALRHTITTHRITLRVFEGSWQNISEPVAVALRPGWPIRNRPRAGNCSHGRLAVMKWAGRRELRRLAFPAAQRRALERIFSAASGSARR